MMTGTWEGSGVVVSTRADGNGVALPRNSKDSTPTPPPHTVDSVVAGLVPFFQERVAAAAEVTSKLNFPFMLTARAENLLIYGVETQRAFDYLVKPLRADEIDPEWVLR